MAEAHIPRIIHRRGRGRPRGSPPLFVEECAVRVEATELLAKSRGADVGDGLVAWPLTLTWTEYGRTRVRQLIVPVTTSVQPLGGVRRWWQCPRCQRRCGVLLAASAETPIGCRRCLRAAHLADYPAGPRSAARHAPARLLGGWIDHIRRPARSRAGRANRQTAPGRATVPATDQARELRTFQIPWAVPARRRRSIEGAKFWVADESPQDQNFSPETLGGATTRLVLVVPDPAAVHARALAQGAKEVWPVHEEYGWDMGRVVDPFGHHWEIGKPLAPGVGE